MQRRLFIALGLVAQPGAAAFAQTRPTPQQMQQFHDDVLARDFATLPPGARERVSQAFRAGTPDIGEEAIRQRWDAMTPGQRGEVLTMHHPRGRGTGPGYGPGAGPGPRDGMGPGPGRGPGMMQPGPARPPQ